MVPEHRPPTPPDDVLLEEFLKPLGISQAEAARLMGIPATCLGEIVCGKRGITADTALCLARLLDTSAGFWIGLQEARALYALSHPERTGATDERTAC